jgi:hypothetical protein
VLGGGPSPIDPLYEEVPGRREAFVFSGGLRDVVRTRLVRSRHGDSSGLRGVAWPHRCEPVRGPFGACHPSCIGAIRPPDRPARRNALARRVADA